VFVILGNSYDIKLGQWRSDANSLLSAQELWFAAFMTLLHVNLIQSINNMLTIFSILTPWVTLRKVPVEVEIVCFSSVLAVLC
jgi:heme/copper-type cytochrome/quinol oxidase subunit 1